MEKEPKPTFGVGDFYDFMEANVPLIECAKGRIRQTEWLSEWGIASAFMGGGICHIRVTDAHQVLDMRWSMQLDGVVVMCDHEPDGTSNQREAGDNDWDVVRRILDTHPGRVM